MTDKTNDYSTLTFTELKAKLEETACKKDAFSIATWMFVRDPEKAQQLLPEANPATIDANGDGKTTSHEWAAVLVSAKKAKPRER